MPKLKDKQPHESLDGRQETFCQLMSIGKLSATEAYRQAGYSDRGADGHSARAVVNGRIKNRIAYLRAELAQKEGITRETQSKKLALVAEKCLGNGEHSTYVRAIEAQNRLYGLDKQVIEQQQPADRNLNQTEAEQAAEYAEFKLWQARQGTNVDGADSFSGEDENEPEGNIVAIGA